MKLRLLVFLFFLLTAGGLQAQIQRDYLQRYTDGIQDSIFTTLDVIELQDGGVALLARLTQSGEGDFSPAIYRFDENGSLVDSIILDREGTLFSGQFSQATDGTFWVAVQHVNVSSGIEDTRLLHITGDLETVVKDETVDIVTDNGPESVYGLLPQAGSLVVVAVSSGPVEGEDFDQRLFTMAKFDQATLDQTATRQDPIPYGSWSSSNEIELTSLPGDTSFAFSVRINDSVGTANTLLIREFSTADLSTMSDITVPDIGFESWAMDYAYLAGTNTYAFTNRGFNTLLIPRGQGESPTIDTVMAPEGLANNGSFLARLYTVGDSIYVLGRGGYIVPVAGDSIGSVSAIGNFFSIGDAVPTSEGLLLSFTESNSSAMAPTRFLFSPADSAYTDTLTYYRRAARNGTNSYFGVYPFEPAVNRTVPYFGLAQRKTESDSINTFAYEIIDPATGERTGQDVAPVDISDWYGNFGFDMSPLVGVGDEYMMYTIENNRILFFKFTESLDPVLYAGNNIGGTFFDPLPGFLFDFRNSATAATSYGIIGATYGGNFGPQGLESKPYVYAADTTFSTRIQSSIDTFQYRTGSPVQLVVDSTDQIYVIGQEANSFNSTDTLNITAHRADGSLRYARQIDLTDAPYLTTTLQNAVLSADESQMLLSGIIRDSVTHYGYAALIDLIDTMGTPVIVTLTGEDLGYSLGNGILSHAATFDHQGNFILGTVIDDPSPDGGSFFDVRVLQLDSSLAVVGDVTILQTAANVPSINNIIRVDSAIYISGVETPVSGTDQQAYMARLSEGIAVSTDEPNLTEQYGFAIFPNPTTLDKVTLQWDQIQAGPFELRLFNTTGQNLKQYRGTQPAGSAQFDLPLNNLPKGTYFVRLDVPGGFMIQTIIKQ